MGCVSSSPDVDPSQEGPPPQSGIRRTLSSITENSMEGSYWDGTSMVHSGSQDVSNSEIALAELRQVAGGPRRISLKELVKATDGFSPENFVGEGTFGKVYRGRLPIKLFLPTVKKIPSMVRSNSLTSSITSSLSLANSNTWLSAGSPKEEVYVDVAVKKLYGQAFAGYKGYITELGVLEKLRHPSLIRVLAYCHDKDEAALVFEFCARGSLAKALREGVADGEALPWRSRVSIASNVARGLAAIHKCNVIHRDLKANNILLTERYEAKLSDFGLAHGGPESDKESHVSTKVLGTLGYLDPAYMESGWLTFKSDVYSFGVILLELITGRRSVSKEGVMLSVEMAPHLSNSENSILQFVDPLLGGNFSKPGVCKLARLAKSCLHIEPEKRPAVADLLGHLARIEK